MWGTHCCAQLNETVTLKPEVSLCANKDDTTKMCIDFAHGNDSETFGGIR